MSSSNKRLSIGLTHQSQGAVALFCHKAAIACLFAMVIKGVDCAYAVPMDSDSSNTSERYTVFVSDAIVYDNNVFGLPSDQASSQNLISPRARHSDYSDIASIGSADMFEYGRQMLNLDLQINESRYARNTFLNNASGNADLKWAWEYGSNASGDAGFDYVRQLAKSSQTLFYGKDLVASTTEFADMRYELNSQLVLLAGLRDVDTSNSAPELQADNYHSKSGNVGLEFDSSDTNSVGFEYRYSDVRALQNFANVALNSSNYNEDTERISGKYAVDDKTQFEGYVGYLKRRYPNSQFGAFSGDIWRLNTNYYVTERTSLRASVGRDLEAYFDAQSNYFVADGESISPAWSASEKLNIYGVFSWAKQHYIASNPSFYTLGVRRDSVASQQINIEYDPASFMIVSIAYTNERHLSTLSLFNYADRVWTGSIKIVF